MGVVYKARDTRLDRFVALKLMLLSTATTTNSNNNTGDQLRRFALEAKAASSLNHPNIVIAYDVASENEALYIVMEYVPGRTLEEELASEQKLPLADVLKSPYRSPMP